MDFWLDGGFFADDLGRINSVLLERPDASLTELFADWPIYLYASVFTRDLSGLPALQKRLPRMPHAALQHNYNGSSGELALLQAAGFIQVTSTAFAKIVGKPFEHARVLDYGLGWGRLLRVALRYIPESCIVGCDAWASSVDDARALGFRSEIVKVDAFPDSLPFSPHSFDIVWASSIFTHLTREYGLKILQAIQPVMKKNSLLALTIWLPECFPEGHALREGHSGHSWVPVDGIDPKYGYGDATVSLDFIRREWDQWEIAGTEIGPYDPKQFIVFLQPKQCK